MPAPEPRLVGEASRQLVICNACRYCEGLCPVFRAIETRRDFAQGDVFYLANLCHDCRACYYACMFTPPHEFALNIPKILSEARLESYREWSWPGLLARAFHKPRITLWLAGLAALLAILVAVWWVGPSRLFIVHTGRGAFYAIVPYLGMMLAALGIFLLGMAIWLRGALRSWSEISASSPAPLDAKTLWAAIDAVLSQRHLEGGGPGCTYPDERPTSTRRIYHGLVFWGFLTDFVSTVLAFIDQEFRHMLPPYPLASAPVICGTVGGVLLIVGTAGLVGLKQKSDRAPAGQSGYGIDYTFLVTLGLVALTGLLTLVVRATAALGSLLVLHLALVAALFITAPYGKFVHAVYRSLALLRYYAERARATPLR